MPPPGLRDRFGGLVNPGQQWDPQAVAPDVTTDPRTDPTVMEEVQPELSGMFGGGPITPGTQFEPSALAPNVVGPGPEVVFPEETTAPRARRLPTGPGDIQGHADYELYSYLDSIPGAEEIRPRFGDAYDLDPALELAGSAEAGEAYADPNALAAGYEGLQGLEQQADQGFLPAELAAMEQMGQRQDTSLRGGEMAQYEQMEQMGLGGAGMEQMQALNAAQSGAQQAAMRDLQVQAASEERKRWATTAAGQMGADLAEQSFNQDYARGEAQDIAARTQSKMKQDYEERRAADQEREALAAIALTQQRAGQQQTAVEMLQDRYSTQRRVDVNEDIADVRGQAATPQQPSKFAKTVSAIGEVGSIGLDLYKDSQARAAADLAKAEKETDNS